MQSIDIEPTTKHMLGRIFKQSYPTILGLFLATMVEVISIAFVGNLDSTTLLSSIAIANMLVAIFNITVVMGFNYALCEYIP
jgi:Na+-driven multidrug efflux pump